MAGKRVDPQRQMDRRLRAIRRAYGKLKKREEMSQAEFARLCGIAPPTWNNAETGDNRIGIDNAIAVCRRTGVTLDFIYFGNPAGLPLELAHKLDEVEREELGRAS